MRSFKRHNGWRRALQYIVAAALLLVAPTAAQANFSGPYAPSNWTFSNGSQDGSVNFVDPLASPSITLTGADNGAEDVNTDFTIAAAGTGPLSFSFDWDNQDEDPFGDDPIFDFGGFLHKGVLVEEFGGASDSGTFATDVSAGDIIGFQVSCTDCVFGPGVLTISDFSAPVGGVSVPEPGTLILLALGAAGLAVGRLRRRVN